MIKYQNISRLKNGRYCTIDRTKTFELLFSLQDDP